MRQVGCSVIETHAKYEALAEMQGLFAFRVRSTEVVRSAVNRLVEGSNPSCPAKFASLALMVERSLCKRMGSGSSPLTGTKSQPGYPAKELTLLDPHLASIAAGFFKAHYHQEPDPTNSLLNICGYGGLVRFKKENPHYGGLRENGRQETALTASCLICSCL